jgi:hypothetical protein
MPRSYDKYPTQRGQGGSSLYSPTRGGLPWTDPMTAIDKTAKAAGGQINDAILGAFDGIVDLIKDLTGLDLRDLAGTWDNLLAMFSGIDFAATDFDPDAAVRWFAEHILSPLLPGADWSQLYAQLTGDPGGDLAALGSFLRDNLFGPVLAHRIPQVSVATIGEVFDNNLIANPHFENLKTENSSVWDFDPDVSHSPVGGSAKMTADGTGSKDLLSNLIPASLGQRFDLSVWTKWSGMTGSGTPIQLGVTTYLSNSAVGQPVIASHALTPPTSDWVKLSGSYTVPENVDAIRVRLTLTPSATAGTVWWDDSSLYKVGLLQQLLVMGTDAGDTLTNDIENLFTGIISNAAGLLERALQGDLTALREILHPSGLLADIAERQDSFLDQLSPLNGSNVNQGSIGNNFLPGVLTEIDNNVRSLLGIGGSGYSHTDSSNALAHVSDTLAGLTSRVTDLTNRLSGGNYASDSFERSGSNLGADWHVTYLGSAGTVRTDGHNAYFSKSGMSDRIYIARHIPLVTLDDDQIISIALNSQAEKPLLTGLTGNAAYNMVLGRMSADNLNYIEFRMGNGNSWIYRVINGVYSEVCHDTYSGPDPGPGSALTLLCGKEGSKRYLEGRHNGNGVTGAPDTGSMMGSAFRCCGFGGFARDWPIFLTQSAPGAVRQWTGGDQ